MANDYSKDVVSAGLCSALSDGNYNGFYKLHLYVHYFFWIIIL